MQPLHDDDDGTLSLVVEAAIQGVVVPSINPLSFCFRFGIHRLDRIIDNNSLATATGKGSTGRGSQPKPVCGRFDLTLGVFSRIDTRMRKCLPVPSCFDD